MHSENSESESKRERANARGGRKEFHFHPYFTTTTTTWPIGNFSYPTSPLACAPQSLSLPSPLASLAKTVVTVFPAPLTMIDPHFEFHLCGSEKHFHCLLMIQLILVCWCVLTLIPRPPSHTWTPLSLSLTLTLSRSHSISLLLIYNSAKGEREANCKKEFFRSSCI